MRDGPSRGENQAAGSGKQNATVLRSQRNSDDSFSAENFLGHGKEVTSARTGFERKWRITRHPWRCTFCTTISAVFTGRRAYARDEGHHRNPRGPRGNRWPLGQTIGISRVERIQRRDAIARQMGDKPCGRQEIEAERQRLVTPPTTTSAPRAARLAMATNGTCPLNARVQTEAIPFSAPRAASRWELDVQFALDDEAAIWQKARCTIPTYSTVSACTARFERRQHVRFERVGTFVDRNCY
jgi:hypothetical protein